MSQSAALTDSTSSSAKRFTADSFSKSVLLLGCLLVLQRGIGFIRSFYVCGTLSPEEVGQWDLCFNFLSILAPLAVFGIPGSFGRYVAKYEEIGQQSRLLLQTAVACLALTAIASTLIWFFRETVSHYFFGSSNNADTVALLALGIPLVAFFNFSTSWFTGKRLNRLVFRLQFAQTIFFACLCVVAFRFYSASAIAVVLAYMASCMIALCLAASYAFSEHESSSPGDSTELLSIWDKILPFAVWVWISNALYNAFAICDRMLMVNFYPDPSADVQYLIGQYHTACIFPLLLMTLGAMASSMVLPYLSKDWEAGSKDLVVQRMNLLLKGVGILCLFASVAILLISPILFSGIWKDKFQLGESMLPLALCFCSLGAMNFVAQMYFWCIEKTWYSSLVLLIGLVCNFSIGLVLIGPFGIHGVVVATLVSHSVILLSVLLLCGRHGMRVDRGVFVIGLGLLAISFGKIAAFICFAILLMLALCTPIFFPQSFKQEAFAKVRAMIESARG